MRKKMTTTTWMDLQDLVTSNDLLILDESDRLRRDSFLETMDSSSCLPN
jgi:hypothetical protein